jgi:hypothetical protein
VVPAAWKIADDGSGSVDIRNVKHDVAIDNKGSGSVRVSDIGGNFRVGNKGGGSVTWERERTRRRARPLRR